MRTVPSSSGAPAWRPRVLQAAVAACPVAVSIADATMPGLALVYVDEAFAALTRYGLQDVIGRNWRPGAQR